MTSNRRITLRASALFAVTFVALAAFAACDGPFTPDPGFAAARR